MDSGRPLVRCSPAQSVCVAVGRASSLKQSRRLFRRRLQQLLLDTDTSSAAAMSNKAKPGVEDGEKQSPTDLQEIQLQMNATTDEVNRTAVTSTIRPIIIHGVASLRFVLARRWAGLACMHLKHNSCRGRRTPHPSVICVKLLRAVVNQRRADLQRRTLATQRLRAAFRVPSASGAVCPRLRRSIHLQLFGARCSTSAEEIVTAAVATTSLHFPSGSLRRF